MGTQTWSPGWMAQRRVWEFATIALLWAIPVIAQEPEVIAAGKRELQRSYATCHGVDATGDGPSAAVLNVKPADLTPLSKKHGGVFLFWWGYEEIEGSKEVVIQGYGTREMPIWGALSLGAKR